MIAKAKVPIVKFEDVSTGLAFDISFDVANGPKTAEYVVKLMKGLPGMDQLVKILKLFLQQRELNEVRHHLFQILPPPVIDSFNLFQEKTILPYRNQKFPILLEFYSHFALSWIVAWEYTFIDAPPIPLSLDRQFKVK